MKNSRGSFLDRLLDPVARCLSPQAARSLVKLRLDAEAQARLDELAEKSNEGELSKEERAECESYVSARDLIGILQSKARKQLIRSREAS
jgi:hypothetical protein